MYIASVVTSISLQAVERFLCSYAHTELYFQYINENSSVISSSTVTNRCNHFVVSSFIKLFMNSNSFPN